jgi:hypothetical protein
MEKTKMKTFKLRRNGLPSLSFAGERIADVSSHSHEGPRQNRWTEICLYRTQGGKFVAWIVGRTCWQGESDRYEAHVCDTEADLIEALKQEDNDGYLSDLAKEALDEAMIDCVEQID